MTSTMLMNRRAFIGAATTAPLLASRLAAQPITAAAVPTPVAAQAAPDATAKMISVPGARLFYRDSGGSGLPIILQHPQTGSAETWMDYQWSALQKAGLRVIAWSRRGFRGTEVEAGASAGSIVDDILAIADAAGLRRFVLLGSGGGGFSVPDFALSYPERLAGIVMTCTQGGCVEPDYRAALERMNPPGFAAMPATFRELAPAYRALNPEGTARWAALEETARTGPRISQRPRNVIDYASLQRIRVPALVLTGAADLYIPPALARFYADRLANARFEVLDASAHSAYWEQPNLFNRHIAAFAARLRA